MTIIEALNWGTQQLLREGSQPENASLDAEVLLAHILSQTKEYLFTYHQQTITPDQFEAFKIAVQERIHGMPIAYITGVKSFYGRNFSVTPDVLIPRPETEMMIELIQAWLAAHPIQAPVIVDIGTGSGCLAITAALEIPESRVIATDISKKACAVAQTNTDKFSTSIDIVTGNLLEPLGEQPIDILLANLPYGTPELFTDASIAHEPPEALYADDGGLALYHTLFKQVAGRKFPPQYMVVEFDPRQSYDIVQLAHHVLPDYLLNVVTDLTEQPRFLELMLKPSTPQ